jgi:hypothetical protein
MNSEAGFVKGLPGVYLGVRWFLILACAFAKGVASTDKRIDFVGDPVICEEQREEGSD